MGNAFTTPNLLEAKCFLYFKTVSSIRPSISAVKYKNTKTKTDWKATCAQQIGTLLARRLAVPAAFPSVWYVARDALDANWVTYSTHRDVGRVVQVVQCNWSLLLHFLETLNLER